MADITNQHFNYDFKSPVYQPIEGVDELFAKFGQNSAFDDLVRKFKSDREEKVQSETSSNYADSLGIQAPVHYKVKRDTPQSREDILAKLTEAYPSIPPPELEVMADQRVRHQKLTRQYNDNAALRDMAFDSALPSIMQIFDKRDIELGNQLRESERGLKGMDDDFKTRSSDLSQKRVLFQNLLSFVNSPNFANIPDEAERNVYINALKKLRTEISKYPGWDIFSGGQEEAEKQGESVEQTGEQTGESFDFDAFVDKLYETPGMTKAKLKNQFQKIVDEKKLKTNTLEYKRARDYIEDLYADANAAHEKKQKDAAFALSQARGAKEFEHDSYQYYVSENFPTLDKDIERLGTKISQANRMLENAKGNASGAGYMALKALLGDTINGSDFQAMLGKNMGEGLFAKIKTAVGGGTPITDAEARQAIGVIVKSLNTEIRDFNARLDNSDDKYKSKLQKFKKEPVKGLR